VNAVESLGSIKCWETTEWLHNWWPLEWRSAPQAVRYASLAATPLRWSPQLAGPHFKLRRNTKYFVFLRSVLRLLVTANAPTSPILVTLMMEALSSSETSVLTRTTRRNIPEAAIRHSHRRENLKPYIIYSCFLKIHFNIILSSTCRSCLRDFLPKIVYEFDIFLRVLHVYVIII
jgi:hypothetical protein